MTDDDLRAAVAAYPDDDTPRLAYADYVEDAGDPDRGRFIRDQIRFASTPEWEPFAVHVRHFRRHDIWPGTQFVPPPIPGAGPYVTRHPKEPTRRGFAYALKVESLHTFLKVAPELFEREPVQHLDLPSGTLDEWRVVAASPWFRNVRSVRFTGLTTPIDPLRELAESPNAEGLREIAFDRCDSPAMPEVLRRLLRSGLGRRLTSLALRLGEYPEEMTEAFEGDAPELPRLTRLKWERMGTGPDLITRLFESPALRDLRHLELIGDHVTAAGTVAVEVPPLALDTFAARDCGLTALAEVAELLANRYYLGGEHVRGVRRLDLAGNLLARSGSLWPLGEPGWNALRSLGLARTGVGPEFLAELSNCPWWPGVVEIDLSDNRLHDDAGEALLAQAAPRDLAAIHLGGNDFSPNVRGKLDRAFAGATVWV